MRINAAAHDRSRCQARPCCLQFCLFGFYVAGAFDGCHPSFHDQHHEIRRRTGFVGLFRIWCITIVDLFRLAPREHAAILGAEPVPLALHLSAPCPRCEAGQLEDSSYAELLGWYLGDGHISTGRRSVYNLHVFNDQRYSALNARIQELMRAVKPGGRPHIRLAPGCVIVHARLNDGAE